MKNKSGWVAILTALLLTDLRAEKPYIDWYARRDPSAPLFYERPDFLLMNWGRHSDVLLLSDWTLLEVEAKRAEGYKKIIGFITEPSLSMDHLFDPFNHLRDPRCGPSSWIETHLDQFDLILTFNRYLLDTYPDKCKFLHAVGYGTLYDHGIHEKTKLCSHMVSDQRKTEGHLLRWEIAEKLGKYFDACKEGNTPFVEWKDPWLNDFCFSVIVENCQEAHYFSEKILECMRAGTIPIYWGCPTIGDFFDREGIITFDSLEELESILQHLSFEEYYKRMPAIQRNFELAGAYPQYRLGPCRHKSLVMVDPARTWEYSKDRPDVYDGVWPYVKEYFEPYLNTVYYELAKGTPPICVTKKTEEIGATWNRGTVWGKNVIEALYAVLDKRKHVPCVVIDVGAQTGCFTLLSKFFPQSTWFAFEPLGNAATELKRNLLLNEINNVSVYEMAASNTTGSASLKVPKGQWHEGLATLGDNPVRFASYEKKEVKCIALDEFVASHAIGKVDVLKVHTQGWELHVLHGAESLIARDRPVLFLELNAQNCAQCGTHKEDVLEFLKKYGYAWEMLSSEDLLCTPSEQQRKF